MTSGDNDALCSLSRRWHLEGDWMVCQCCKRPLIASREHELLAHKDGCKNDGQHPWRELRAILTAAPEPADNCIVALQDLSANY